MAALPLDPRATAISNVTTAKEFRQLTPNDTDDLGIDLKALYALTTGDAICEDFLGNVVTFPVAAGQILYIRPKFLRAATTATMVGLFV